VEKERIQQTVKILTGKGDDLLPAGGSLPEKGPRKRIRGVTGSQRRTTFEMQKVRGKKRRSGWHEKGFVKNHLPLGEQVPKKPQKTGSVGVWTADACYRRKGGKGKKRIEGGTSGPNGGTEFQDQGKKILDEVSPMGCGKSL